MERAFLFPNSIFPIRGWTENVLKWTVIIFTLLREFFGQEREKLRVLKGKSPCHLKVIGFSKHLNYQRPSGKSIGKAENTVRGNIRNQKKTEISDRKRSRTECMIKITWNRKYSRENCQAECSQIAWNLNTTPGILNTTKILPIGTSSCRADWQRECSIIMIRIRYGDKALP